MSSNGGTVTFKETIPSETVTHEFSPNSAEGVAKLKDLIGNRLFRDKPELLQQVIAKVKINNPHGITTLLVLKNVLSEEQKRAFEKSLRVANFKINHPELIDSALNRIAWLKEIGIIDEDSDFIKALSESIDLDVLFDEATKPRSYEYSDSSWYLGSCDISQVVRLGILNNNVEALDKILEKFKDITRSFDCQRVDAEQLIESFIIQGLFRKFPRLLEKYTHLSVLSSVSNWRDITISDRGYQEGLIALFKHGAFDERGDLVQIISDKINDHVTQLHTKLREFPDASNLKTNEVLMRENVEKLVDIIEASGFSVDLAPEFGSAQVSAPTLFD